MIRSKNHNIYTIQQNKQGLSLFDDKRCLFKDQTDTLLWGHYKVNVETNNFIQYLKNLNKNRVIEKQK